MVVLNVFLSLLYTLANAHLRCYSSEFDESRICDDDQKTCATVCNKNTTIQDCTWAPCDTIISEFPSISDCQHCNEDNCNIAVCVDGVVVFYRSAKPIVRVKTRYKIKFPDTNAYGKCSKEKLISSTTSSSKPYFPHHKHHSRPTHFSKPKTSTTASIITIKTKATTESFRTTTDKALFDNTSCFDGDSKYNNTTLPSNVVDPNCDLITKTPINIDHSKDPARLACAREANSGTSPNSLETLLFYLLMLTLLALVPLFCCCMCVKSCCTCNNPCCLNARSSNARDQYNHRGDHGNVHCAKNPFEIYNRFRIKMENITSNKSICDEVSISCSTCKTETESSTTAEQIPRPYSVAPNPSLDKVSACTCKRKSKVPICMRDSQPPNQNKKRKQCSTENREFDDSGNGNSYLENGGPSTINKHTYADVNTNGHSNISQKMKPKKNKTNDLNKNCIQDKETSRMLEKSESSFDCKSFGKADKKLGGIYKKKTQEKVVHPKYYGNQNGRNCGEGFVVARAGNTPPNKYRENSNQPESSDGIRSDSDTWGTFNSNITTSNCCPSADLSSCITTIPGRPLVTYRHSSPNRGWPQISTVSSLQYLLIPAYYIQNLSRSTLQMLMSGIRFQAPLKNKTALHYNTHVSNYERSDQPTVYVLSGAGPSAGQSWNDDLPLDSRRLGTHHYLKRGEALHYEH